MFQQRAFQVATKARTGLHLALSEFVATFALLALIALVGKRNAGSLPLCVAAYITSAYWFTSSTSFANPAVTVARTMTDTFCGIAPQGVLPFVTAQFLAAAASFALLRHVRETHGSV
jgi:glycerol uptake facilitator-like aquaporin